MTAMPTPRANSLDVLERQIRGELGRPARLSDAFVNAVGFDEFVAGDRHQLDGGSLPLNALLTDPGLDAPGIGRARPERPASTPLLDAITVVDEVESGSIEPVTVSVTSVADEVAEGAPMPEATLTYTVQPSVTLPTISHFVPVTGRAIRRDGALRSDIDTFLVGGVLVKLEERVAAALTGASGMVVEAFSSDVATTIRNGVASAQNAFRELGPGRITVALSPTDHATLDLAGVDTSEWPCTIISTPAFPVGTAYIGRMRLAVHLYATSVAATATAGYVDDQFIRGQVTLAAQTDAFAHVAAPSAIVTADLTP